MVTIIKIWQFPEKWYRLIGYTVRGFSFRIKNATREVTELLNTKDNLTNIESGVEEKQNQKILFF